MGNVVNIAPGHVGTEPMRLRTDGSESVEVRAGAGARVTIIDEVQGNNNHSVELYLDEGAEVEFISINTSLSPVVIKQQSHLQNQAKIRWRNITLGSNVEHDLRSELLGAEAVSDIDWMFYGKAEEKYRLIARNVFLGKRGRGEITMKGVAEQKGHVRCNGMIEIGQQAAGTDTYLTQDVLMLDKTAKVDAVPGLEIKTNDVKASHSATVSKVTDEDLFYFGTRGIAERDARRMFVEGFLAQMIRRIGDAQTQEAVFALAERKSVVK